MKKPDTLRRTILSFVPTLAADPAKLSFFVDKGRIAARAGGTLSLEYRYTLNVVIEDYAGDVDDLMVPLLAWIAEQQPDLFEGTDPEPFAFESELLDADRADVSISVELTEAVRVTPKEGGGFDADHLEEPRHLDEFPGICCVNLWQLFMRDQLVAQTSDPAFVSDA
ncbi:tail completion protein R (GpR) [Sphingomonas sp. PP-F2F-A104-K0414]|uniref:phage tail protein n=1 Tax=Sphingomonas sp. PP-F2F-A104-K0414 TaxID=2135661 RepID=UPI00105156B8|nr:phage tail protein [Sphingomonas sp. PP-F2F-A104-K0414]TCP95281.1 tail completion protein R (GpR) [Sphingomonas sp. PP-F2F-A104-K0414]